MMDAKKALTETGGDMEAAIDWLRTKGLAKAAKKSGRTAAEGLVGVAVKGGVGVAVEVNSETDFVARNSDFQAIVRAIAEVATGCSDIEAAARRAARRQDRAGGGDREDRHHRREPAPAPHGLGRGRERRLLRAQRGRRRASARSACSWRCKGADNGIGKQIAMHVAATSPASLSEADLDPALIEREKAVLTEQARESGKPEAVIEKMIAGRMNKFFEEVTLLNQKFVINPDVTVGQAAKDAGVEVVGFARLAVGEGVEKETEDFAAEVAKTAGR